MYKSQKSSKLIKIFKNIYYKSNINKNMVPGTSIIKIVAKNLPFKPGVYQMENEKGEILYIGKAKNLRKRVITYANLSNLTRRLQRMILQTNSLNFTITNSETEALLLECSLIKRHKPKFNIILRDDKSFPYILINKEHKYPRIQKYRGLRNIKGDYFGPFVSPSVADKTLLSIEKTFLLRSCSDSVFSNRSRPCLLYDIKRCSAPCVKRISEKDYNESIIDTKKFLSGNIKGTEKKLKKLMTDASKNQAYEEASRLRDRLKALNQIQKYQSVFIRDLRDIDIFGIKLINGKSCIFGMFYRNGSNYGNKAFFPYHDEKSDSFEIMESFLFQFYANKEPPPKILVNIKYAYLKNVEKILREKNNSKLNIINPKIGEKHKHILLAEKNAIENLRLKNSNIENHKRFLTELKNILSIDFLPNRIEVYDNSHIFGSQPIGVMIVVNEEGFENKSYRKFNIRYENLEKTKSRINDYYMLEEVLKRRFSIEKNINEWPIPQIIIIDGGKGHMNIAKKVLPKNKLIKLIAVAKGKKRNLGQEIIYFDNKFKKLNKSNSFLHFIQRVRDEAHRFAINSHKKRRFKYSIKSVFDEIKGIGAKRKKILIEHFGSINNIKNAKIEELYDVKGIDKNLAEQIYGFFNSQ